MTAAPLAVFVDGVLSSTSSLPLITALRPTFKFFSIPTPPSTTSAPVSLSVESVASSISVCPPTISFFCIPTPP